MLETIRPKKDEHAARILKAALNLWRDIDRRAFGASPYETTPFKELEIQAQTARDLLNKTKSTIKSIKATFVNPPEKILKTFTESVAYYRGELAFSSVHLATRLAAYELVHDAGVTPYIPRPEMQIADESHSKDEKKATPIAGQETSPRKVINYGRPEADATQSNTALSNQPPDDEIRRQTLRQSALEGQAFIREQQLKEHKDFTGSIRRPRTLHERYGHLMPRLPSTENPRKLPEIPDWIQYAIEVAAADSTQDTRPIPPIQDVALKVADWAEQFIRHADLYAPSESIANWNLAWLQNLLAPVIKYHTHCKHVIQVVEDLSQQIRELGGYESLPDEDKAVVDTLAPAQDASALIDTKHSWGGEPISSEVARQVSTAQAQQERIRLLALNLLRNRPGDLRFIEDAEKAWQVAMRMAKEAIKHPRRPLE
jgi:hypothetical protein